MLRERHAEVPPDLLSWRTRLLTALLRVIALAGVPLMVLVLIEATRHPEQWPAALMYLSIYATMAALSLLRRADHRTRFWALLVGGYAVAGLAMARGGLAGDGRLYLLVLPALISIAWDVRAGIAASLVSVLMYGLFAVTADRGWMAAWLVRAENPLGLGDWVVGGASLTMCLAVIVTLQWTFHRFQKTAIHHQVALLNQAREAEARYRAVSELASDFAYSLRIDPDGRLELAWIAGDIERITGFHPEEVDLRCGLESLIHSKDLPVLEESLRVLRSGQPHTTEIRILTKSGEVRWLRNFARPEWDEEEGRVTYIIGAARDITAEKEAQQALEESERRFRTFTEANLAGVYIMQDGVVQYINPALANIIGYSPEEVIGRLGIPELIHPDEQAFIEEQMRRRLTDEPEGVRHVLRAVRKDGTTVYCEVLARRIEYEGRPAILGTVLDVTQQVHAKERLERRVAQLTLLKNVAREMTTLSDPATALKQAVQLVQRTFGYEHVAIFTPDPSSGSLVMRARAGELSAFFPPGHWLPQGCGMVGWVAEHGEFLLANDVDQEPRYVNFFPDVIPTRSELAVAIKTGRKVIGVLDVQSKRLNAFDEEDVLVLRTVADQIAVAMENARLYEVLQRELERRRQAMAALQESENTARVLLNSIGEAVMLLDSTGSVLAANEAAAKVLGQEVSQVVGGRFPELVRSVLPADVGDSRWNHIQRAVRSARAVRFEDRVDGRLFEHNVYPVPGPGKKVTRLAVLSRDITERREMARRIAHAEQLAVLGRLAAVLAHEINNPLQAIQSHLELALEFTLDPAEHRTHLSIAHREVERLADIARRMLQLAQPTGEKRREIAVAELVERTLSLVDKQLKKRGIEVTVNLPEDLPRVTVAPNQMVQVLLNLFINAQEAMPDGGRIDLRARAEGEKLVLTLANSGPPIPEEHIAHIFDPFFTTKASGTGLGLAICDRLVRENRGTIRAENLERDQGVAFIITLPVGRASS